MKAILLQCDYEDCGRWDIDTNCIDVNDKHYITIDHFIDDDGEFILIDHWREIKEGDWEVDHGDEFLVQLVE